MLCTKENIARLHSPKDRKATILNGERHSRTPTVNAFSWTEDLKDCNNNIHGHDVIDRRTRMLGEMDCLGTPEKVKWTIQFFERYRTPGPGSIFLRYCQGFKEYTQKSESTPKQLKHMKSTDYNVHYIVVNIFILWGDLQRRASHSVVSYIQKALQAKKTIIGTFLNSEGTFSNFRQKRNDIC